MEVNSYDTPERQFGKGLARLSVASLLAMMAIAGVRAKREAKLFCLLPFTFCLFLFFFLRLGCL
jgi:hypothetical protein